ncbi:MAG: nuclease PIN [Ignavibacteria bacterium GWA2_35_9]|nr:MAG: nuclease PIN [Ignavibacteria bacterium GWA2_35_9]OGU53483.1 MAG: nuclease PIN [Ignavibacteria bacterium GWC2_36_12]
MRSVNKLYKAIDEPMQGLSTYRAFPNRGLDSLDPFILLNHHGPQNFPRDNTGLPFSPHPHRGFETLTFILKGDVMHSDSSGGKSIITSGGIQWMTAGSGIVHSENSSDNFKKNGGVEEVLQLWINLPSKLKMTPPKYIGLQKDKITKLNFDDGKVIVNLVTGKWGNEKGPIDSLTDVLTSFIEFQKGGNLKVNVDKERNILLYVVDGKINVNNTTAEKLALVEFDNDDEEINIEALEDSILIFCHGKPFNEPVVSYGPFVMNTEAEIRQAIIDYQAGKFE